MKHRNKLIKVRTNIKLHSKYFKKTLILNQILPDIYPLDKKENYTLSKQASCADPENFARGGPTQLRKRFFFCFVFLMEESGSSKYE